MGSQRAWETSERTFELPTKTGGQILDRAKERLAEIERQLASMAELQAEAEMLRKMVAAAAPPNKRAVER